MLHLHDAVQTDLKKLRRNPPLVKLPKISNLHPMLGALPSSVREPLVSHSNEIMKLRGLTLYKEGSKSDGIWLISNGVVKWESKMIKSKNPLYPTFTHGSTLGLYEVLTGRPYICEVVTDSIVQCLFVEAEKIISCLKSDPLVEDFLWQESAIFLSRLLLPQIFEKLTMQDLRALIAERSEITIYIRGETIELTCHSVAFLLEGYVKTQGFQELATAPAALLPSHGSRSFQNLSESVIPGTKEASFIHHGSCYLVETRARVIVFDITAFEPDVVLVRRSSSQLSHAVDHPHKYFHREHSGLMSWPGYFYTQKHHKQSSEQKTTSLSARAMQLSIYGSMVDIPRQSRRLSTNRVRPSPQSLSYPTIASHEDRRPLVSVKSEGAVTGKKDIGVKKFAQHVTNIPSQSTERRKHHVVEDDSSDDDSAVEEDIIVRIDSPRTLSFRQP